MKRGISDEGMQRIANSVEAKGYEHDDPQVFSPVDPVEDIYESDESALSEGLQTQEEYWDQDSRNELYPEGTVDRLSSDMYTALLNSVEPFFKEVLYSEGDPEDLRRAVQHLFGKYIDTGAFQKDLMYFLED